MEPQTIVGIPVRMNSSRFPGKPLVPILGIPMVEHVWRRCQMSEAATRVLVAGCDPEVAAWADRVGAEYVDTDPNISRPSVRVAAAVQGLQRSDDDIVVVVQGDEPLVHPSMIAEVGDPLKSRAVFATNLCAPATTEDLNDPSEIKVVCDVRMNALYMSRAPIPDAGHADDLAAAPLRQVCVFGFRFSNLQAMAFQMQPTPLELCESIEMNRLLEHGKVLRMIRTNIPTKSVDTVTDREVAETMLRRDQIVARYYSES
jgi:3-deoxy-manno-octulosonate cytidylyltransferase (CMP-KDO synthetase)